MVSRRYLYIYNMLGFPRCARGGNVKYTWSSRTDSKFLIQIWRETVPDGTDHTRTQFSLVLSLYYPFSRTQNLFRRVLNPSGYWGSVYVETTTFAKLGELERLAFGRAQFVFSQRNTTSLLPPPTALQLSPLVLSHSPVGIQQCGNCVTHKDTILQHIARSIALGRLPSIHASRQRNNVFCLPLCRSTSCQSNGSGFRGCWACVGRAGTSTSG